MADLALTAAQIALVDPDQAETFQAIAAATITAGQSVYRDSAGKVGLADANAAGLQQTRGIALNGGGAGQAITVVRRGQLYGFTIAQAYDAPIYQSDTAGALADAAGTLSVPVGVIEALTDGVTLTKVLFVDCRARGDYV
jgi:hypothetical protein